MLFEFAEQAIPLVSIVDILPSGFEIGDLHFHNNDTVKRNENSDFYHIFKGYI